MRYLVTFYERDERRHRRYKFETKKVTYKLVPTVNGLAIQYDNPVEKIHKMFAWLDTVPFGKALKSHGIDPAFTDLKDSSILIDVEGEELLDDITVMLMLSCDGTIVPADTVKPRLRDVQVRQRPKDRYAR